MPNEQKYLQSRGCGMIIVHYLGQSNQDSENLSKGQIDWGKPPPELLGAFQQQILPDRTSSGNMATQTARGTHLHSKNVDIVEKYYAKSETR